MQQHANGTESSRRTWIVGFVFGTAATAAVFFGFMGTSYREIGPQIEKARLEGERAALQRVATSLRLDAPGDYRVIAAAPVRVMAEGEKPEPVAAIQALVVDAAPNKELHPARYQNVRLVTIPVIQAVGGWRGATHVTFQRRSVLGKVVESYQFKTRESDPNGPLLSVAFGQDLDLSFDPTRIGRLQEPQTTRPPREQVAAVTGPPAR